MNVSPVGLVAIIGVEALTPGGIRHIRPTILIKPFGLFQPFPGHVQNEEISPADIVRASQGSANSLSPNPRKPPNESTA